jgi:predicted dehydrogenase
MNIGLIGLGYWGKNILRNLNNNSLCENVFCLDPHISKNFSKDNISFFTKEKEFFSRKEIDGYIIASPAETHFYYIKKILKINKFLCVTKPVFKNYEQLKFIKKKFKNYQKIFADHTYIYHPALKVIKNYIDKKFLGKIIYYSSDRCSFGKFYKNQSVVDDLAIHDFYILSYLFPRIKFKKATLVSNNSFYKKNYFSVINLKSNNFFASIKATWHSPYKVRKVIIVGSKKTLIFDDSLSDNKIKIYSKSINLLKNKSYIWEYRVGDLFSPFVENKESLNTMLSNFFFFIKNYKSKKIITNFKHLESVYNIVKLVK